MADSWDLETELNAEGGLSLDMARTATILRWMWHGDLRPLAAAIMEGHAFDEAVLIALALMILDSDQQPYRVETKQRKPRGRPKDMGKFARDYFAAAAYKKNVSRRKSEETFNEIANAIGRSDRTVRQALTWRRKSDK